MSSDLRGGTANTRLFGPFISASDGFTPLTGLSIPNSEVQISRNEGGLGQASIDAGPTHRGSGFYYVTLSSNNVNGLPGRLLVSIQHAGALPVSRFFDVLPADVYDKKYGVVPSDPRVAFAGTVATVHSTTSLQLNADLTVTPPDGSIVLIRSAASGGASQAVLASLGYDGDQSQVIVNVTAAPTDGVQVGDMISVMLDVTPADNAAALLGKSNAGSTVAEQLQRMDTNVSSITQFSASVDNTPIVEARVLKLGSWADGVTVAYPAKTLRRGQCVPFWIRTTDYCGGAWIQSAINPVSSDPSAVAIGRVDDGPSSGVNQVHGVVWLRGIFDEGHSTADITLDLTPLGGQAIPVKFTINLAGDQ